MKTPERQIRAFHTPEFIRVYQAYSDTIAEVALANQTFVSPPFKMERMTWIKPSFLWMMYRAGWGKKDEGQRRILAIDITHDGFAWALGHSISSHRPDDLSLSEWTQLKIDQPVRIQWDPERDLHFNPLAHRAIQIGLSGEAVIRYVEHWIVEITDVTKLASTIHEKVIIGQLDEATALLPQETPYTPTTGQTVG
ncbi:MAG: DUF4291 domain-containing protein [Hyphomonas sp.]|jgi:hypothetical protein|nr:DUF4291 domain-containing protein [Hyphomonas sp.]